MSLKDIIKRSTILKRQLKSSTKDPVAYEMTLPEEPLLYSYKYSLRNRRRCVNFFRDKKFRSFLRTHFNSYCFTKVPVVVLVKFYVTPPSETKIKAADLRKEQTPAVEAYELCDFLLSFLEMLRSVLFSAYKQICKIDTEKYYSNNPRTCFRFMKWSDYVARKIRYSTDTEAESVCAAKRVQSLQPVCKGHEEPEGPCSIEP